MITVLLTCSGIGSRLGNITKYTNKALVKIGEKPAIAYIIDSYPDDTEFIVTLGHFGDHIKQYLNLVYPNKNIKYVDVDNYIGYKASPVYSQLQAKKYLQKPFIYHSCDTITFDNSYIEHIDELKNDTLFGYKTNSGQYDSFNVLPLRFIKDVLPLNDKLYIINSNSIFSKGESLDAALSYVGISYIYDYNRYWKCFEDVQSQFVCNKIDNAPSDFYVFKTLYNNKTLFAYELHSWYDVGNVESLNKARSEFKDSFNILYKEKESIFLQNINNEKYVIKFFYDEGKTNKLYNHGMSIKEVVPYIHTYSNNFIIYKYTDGKVFSNKLIPIDVSNLLKYAADQMWKIKNTSISIDEYKKLLEQFYINKTDGRIKDLVKKYNIDLYRSISINGEDPIKPVDVINDAYNIIKNKINSCNSYPSKWHGDFIPDNIIKTPDNSFKLIDWRDSFMGYCDFGDMYYDLAKLNHNLTVNHKIIYKNEFDVIIEPPTRLDGYDNVYVNILTNETMNVSKYEIKKFIRSKDGYECGFKHFDYDYIEILTGIVWLNMSPLHHNPFDLFLFYFGLWKLNNAIKKYRENE